MSRQRDRRTRRRAHLRPGDGESPAAQDDARPKARRRSILQAAAVFGVLLFAYLINGDILPGKDALANTRLAAKLVCQHKLVFSPEADPFMFQWLLSTPQNGVQTAVFQDWSSMYQNRPIRELYQRGGLTPSAPFYYLIPTRLPGIYANKYGLGAGLFAVPFVAAVSVFVHDIDARVPTTILWHTAKVAAACAVAGSAVFLFLAALAFVRPSTAICVAIAYGLGTCVWSCSSQALWQHGPTELFLAAGTFFLLRENRRASAPWVGFAYAMAFACRPTAAMALAAAAVYYLIRDRRALLFLLLGCAPIVALLGAYNLHYFGKLLFFGQLRHDTGLPLAVAAAHAAPVSGHNYDVFGNSLLSGLAGILVSPSRGLLIFSPAMAFTFWGMVRAWRDPRFSALRPVSLAAVAMSLLVARWYGWWGGWSYGYRLLVDSVTLLAFLAIPVAELIRERRRLLVGFAVVWVWGFAVQVVGAFAYDVVGWNDRKMFQVDVEGRPPEWYTDQAEARRQAWKGRGTVTEVSGDVNSAKGKRRLWQVGDSQIFYYLGHFSEARALKQVTIDEFLRDRG